MPKYICTNKTSWSRNRSRMSPNQWLSRNSFPWTWMCIILWHMYSMLESALWQALLSSYCCAYQLTSYTGLHVCDTTSSMHRWHETTCSLTCFSSTCSTWSSWPSCFCWRISWTDWWTDWMDGSLCRTWCACDSWFIVKATTFDFLCHIASYQNQCKNREMKDWNDAGWA